MEIGNQYRPESNDQLLAEFSGQFILKFQFAEGMLSLCFKGFDKMSDWQKANVVISGVLLSLDSKDIQ